MCENKELLVAFLYDEINPSDRRTFERHLSSCAECRDELAELGDTRAQIASWTPPDADLGFQIVRKSEKPSRWRFGLSPAWGLAAAAILLLAIGAAIANLDIRYGNDGLVVRTGWNHATEAAAASNVTPVDWKAQADQLDQRLRGLERAMAAHPQSPVQNASASDLSDAELLQRVREIVGQSETRQQRAFATRLAEMTREFDARRQLDLATIDQGMTRLQNTSGAEVRQYREFLNRMVRQAAYQEK
jgi:putative zinc finger protein